MVQRFAIALATVVLAATACSRSERAAQPAPSPTVMPWCYAVPIRPACQAAVVAAAGQSLRLAVADNDARRERGLMGVKVVPPGEGMIFVFADGDRTRGFWMKDTITPLDMIFVASDGTVTGTAENVAATKPGTPEAKIARRSGVGRYVIELRAGGVKAAGIEPGAHLAVPYIGAQ